jgi:hypothetical protein
MLAQPSGLDPQMKNPGTNTRDGATILALVAAVLWVSVAKSLSPRIRGLDSKHHREVEVLKTLGQWSGKNFECLPQDQRQ